MKDCWIWVAVRATFQTRISSNSPLNKYAGLLFANPAPIFTLIAETFWLMLSGAEVVLFKTPSTYILVCEPS